jgi:hypothetical protein
MGDIAGGSTADHISYNPTTKKISGVFSSITKSGGEPIGGGLITKEKFTGDGSTAAFNLSKLRQSGSDPMVSVNGVIQEPGVSYTVSDGTVTTITFNSFVPASGDVIVVWYQGQ